MNGKVKKNYLFNLTFQILNVVAPLITMPYVSRVLNASGVGEYSFTYSVISYFLIFASLGTSLYGCREIAREAKDKHRKSIVFFEILSIRILSSIIVTIIYVNFIFFTKFSIFEKKLLIINIFYLLATALDISWLFQGEENFSIITLYTFITKTITIVAVFLFVKNESDVTCYVFIHAILAFANSIFYYFRLGSILDHVNYNELNFTKHIIPVLILLIPQVSKEIYCVLDKTMIGTLYDDRTLNGYYEQAVNIVSMSMTLITSMNIVQMSNLSHDQAIQNNECAIIEKIKNSFHFVWFIGLPVCFGIVSIIDVFVPFFFGAGYEPVATIVYILVPKILIIGISNAIGIQYLITLKRHKEFNISIIFGLFTNALLNMLLIPILSVYGAAIATLASEMIVTITQLFFIRKDFSIKIIFPIDIIKRLISSLAMLIVLFFVKFTCFGFITSYIIQLCIIILLGVILYVLFEIILHDKMMCDVIYLLRDKISRR